MESLPVEICDMILNGVDARGLPFLDPLWRFAARATCKTWRDVVAHASLPSMRLRAKAFRRAWRAPSNGVSNKFHGCHCANGQHRLFSDSLASGRIVSARCAVNRSWVFAWCASDGVPPQDRAIVGLLSMAPASMADMGAVRDLVLPHVESSDPLKPPPPLCPIQRDFWQAIGRVEPRECDDPWDPIESEFLFDTMQILHKWGRYDIMLLVVSTYTTVGVIQNLLHHAAFDDNIEIVEMALVHADRLCRASAPSAEQKWRLWKDAAWSGGTRILDRLLCLCASDNDGASQQSLSDADAALARMARLTRPKDDLSWRKSAVRCNNIDALIVGQRHGVPTRAHELIEMAASRGNYNTVLWLVRHAKDTPDADTTEPLARACAQTLGSIVHCVDDHDSTFDAFDRCLCRARQTNSKAVDTEKSNKGASDGNTECGVERVVDALCDAVLPLMTVDSGIGAARSFLHAYLSRRRHTPAGLALTVRAVDRWKDEIASRIKPRGWSALMIAAITTDAVDALDTVMSLAAQRSSHDLGDIDLWSIAVDHVLRAVGVAVSPLPLLYCGKCADRSPLYKRDRAAATLMRVANTVHDAASRDDPISRLWRALCRPRPVPGTTLGNPDQDSEATASLRVFLGAHALLR